MDKKEFEANKNMISGIMNMSGTISEDVIQQFSRLDKNIKEYKEVITKRDASLTKYIAMLEDFDYADNLSSPIDLFPGIRTAAQTADPEELKAKADEMRQAAFDVKTSQERSTTLISAISQEIRSLFEALKNYAESEDQIYDLSMDLLSKSDSIYDVGNLST